MNKGACLRRTVRPPRVDATSLAGECFLICKTSYRTATNCRFLLVDVADSMIRFIIGVGVGCASMITPLYTSENAPRAIRGALPGMYQFFIVTGVCIAFWINYGMLLHSSGTVQYVVPLAGFARTPGHHPLLRHVHVIGNFSTVCRRVNNTVS